MYSQSEATHFPFKTIESILYTHSSPAWLFLKGIWGGMKIKLHNEIYVRILVCTTSPRTKHRFSRVKTIAALTWDQFVVSPRKYPSAQKIRLISMHHIYRKLTEFARVNRIWPVAVAGQAEREPTLPALPCHIGKLNTVIPGQILLFCDERFFLPAAQRLSLRMV